MTKEKILQKAREKATLATDSNNLPRWSRRKEKPYILELEDLEQILDEVMAESSGSEKPDGFVAWNKKYKLIEPNDFWSLAVYHSLEESQRMFSENEDIEIRPVKLQFLDTPKQSQNSELSPLSDEEKEPAPE